MESQADLDNRDPNNLNEHLQVMWDDVFAEPEGIRSPDKIWECSYKCFRGTKYCCYTFLTAICAPCIACCCGCQFACLAFQQIWCCNPLLRCCKISCGPLRKFVDVCMQTVCAPCFLACGLVFSQAKVRYQRISDGPEPKDSFV